MILDDLTLPDGFSARNGLAADDARCMVRALGISADLGDEFSCIFDDDDEHLAVVDPATLRYQTLYEGAPFEWCSLAEALASRINRRPILYPAAKGADANARHARWWDRLRYQAGLLDLDVPDLVVPERASTAARIVAAGFALVFALNDRRYPGEPVTFARRFAAEWTGLPEWAARQGIRELVDLGALVIVGHVVTGHRPSPLYCPTSISNTTSTLQETTTA